MDSFYFFLAILAGLAEAFKRFYISLFGLLVCQCRINQACLPNWILNIKYLDEFHKSFMCYVYMHCVHNNPIVTALCHDLVESVNQKRQERIKNNEISKGKEPLWKQTLMQKVWNRVIVNMILKWNPELNNGNHGWMNEDGNMKNMLHSISNDDQQKIPKDLKKLNEEIQKKRLF